MAQVENLFGDGFTATGATASTLPHPVLGGRYSVMANGTWNGASATLEMLSADGTNYVAVKDITGAAVTFSSDDFKTVDLPPGMVKFAVGSVTAVALAVVPSPRRRS